MTRVRGHRFRVGEPLLFVVFVGRFLGIFVRLRCVFVRFFGFLGFFVRFFGFFGFLVRFFG
ncbi:MAG: hypothetical protein ACOCS7_02075, partial [Halolamina sp.]